MDYHLKRIKDLGTEKTDKVVVNHFIEENFNFFLNFLKLCRNNNLEITFDDKLNNIVENHLYSNKSSI